VGVHSLSVGRGPAVFLDRDGVLNRIKIRDGMPYAPDTLAELEIPADASDALGRLKRAGFALIVVTNQPDVPRKLQTKEMVEALNAAIGATLPLDEFRVCYHDNADNCPCRKPKPGLLLQDPVYDVGHSYLVGDRWRDIEAGKAAGVRGTVLIHSGHTEPSRSEPDFRAESLTEAADWILNDSKRST